MATPKPYKLRFKRQPRVTGLAAAASLGREVVIKANGKKCGWINPPHWADPHSKWRIWFHIKVEGAWKNICLKVKCESEESAREFVTNNWDKIQNSYDLYLMED